MKRTIKILAAAFVLFAGITACTKEKEGGEVANGTGNLNLSFGFDKNAVETRAAKSDDVIPVTTWAKNIKSMTMFLVNGAGTISDARPVPVSNATNHDPISKLFEGIAVGTYDVYIVANYDQTTTPFGAGAVTSTPGIASLVGTPVANLQFNLNDATGVIGTDAGGSKVMAEPSEIFLAKMTGVKIEANKTNNLSATPLKLTRAVSLLRVRIDQTYDPASTDHDNSGVVFTAANEATFRVRLHGTGLDIVTAPYNSTSNAFPAAPFGVRGITATEAVKTNTLYSAKTFKTAADWTTAKTNYNFGAGEMGLSASDFTLWNEYMILPGGTASTGQDSGKLKFNIVLGGMAPIGYVALQKDPLTGATTGTKTLTAREMVYWTGQVTGVAKPNGVMELNLKLRTQGSVGPVIPPVTEFGNLDLYADLIEWDNTVVYVPIEL